MAELSQEQKERIVDALRNVGAHGPCPRCGNLTFNLLGGYFSQPVQSDLGGLVIGGASVPSAVLICARCGWLAQHALGSLGLLPEPKPEGEEVKK